MTTARNRLAGGTDEANLTEIERLLELYGRSASPEPARDLAERVIAAVAQAVPAVAAPPAPGFARRWLPASGPRLLSGARGLTARLALVAALTVALAAVAFASELQRSADPMPPPAGGAGLVPSPSPAVTPQPSAADDADAFEPEDSDEEDGSGPEISDGDAETDDDRDEPEDGDGDAPDDEADDEANDETDEEIDARSTEEEPSPSASDDPEPDASDAPDDEPDADPEAAPEPTEAGEG